MNTCNQHRANRTIAGVLFPAVAGVMMVLTGCASIPPPTGQLAVSKTAVAEAASAGSNEFAAVELRSATEKMTAAEQAMAEEDYLRAQRLAEQAQVDADVAKTKTALAKAQVAVANAKESNRVLREEVGRVAP